METLIEADAADAADRTPHSQGPMRRVKECHDDLFESALTERIIGAFYTVYNRLGYGHVESVYNRALAVEVRKRGLQAAVQVPIEVFYDEEPVGVFKADLIVESRVVVELKASKLLPPESEMQLTNYLKSSALEVGLLFHFGTKPAFKRMVWTHSPCARNDPPRSAASAGSAFSRPRRAGTIPADPQFTP